MRLAAYRSGIQGFVLITLLPAVLAGSPLSANGNPAPAGGQVPVEEPAEEDADQPEGRGPCGQRAMYILGAATVGALAAGAAYLWGVGPAVASYLWAATPALAPLAVEAAVPAANASVATSLVAMGPTVAVPLLQAWAPAVGDQILADAIPGSEDLAPEAVAERMSAERLLRNKYPHQDQVRQIKTIFSKLGNDLGKEIDTGTRLNNLDAQTLETLKRVRQFNLEVAAAFARAADTTPMTWDTARELQRQLTELCEDFRKANLEGKAPMPLVQAELLLAALRLVGRTSDLFEAYPTVRPFDPGA